MAEMLMSPGELPMQDQKSHMNQWQQGGWDSGIHSGATTANPSVTGGVDDYPDTEQVLREWQRELTMEEANRNIFIYIYIYIFCKNSMEVSCKNSIINGNSKSF